MARSASSAEDPRGTHGFDDRPDLLQAREAGRMDHLRAGLRERFYARDGVSEVIDEMQLADERLGHEGLLGGGVGVLPELAGDHERPTTGGVADAVEVLVQLLAHDLRAVADEEVDATTDPPPLDALQVGLGLLARNHHAE